MCVRHSFLCALMVLASCSRFAQGSGPLVDDLVQHWQKSKDLALATAKTVPENLYLLKASGQENTLGGQLNGMALLTCSAARASAG
jgi:hypothetical protein